MSQFDPDMPEPDEDADPADPANLRRKLRDALKSNKDLTEQVTAAAVVHKENAFLKTGLPDTPIAKFFQENYSGPYDTDAIRTAAADLGIVPKPDQAVQDEITTIGGQSAALNGSETSNPPDARQAEMWKKFTTVVAAGGDGEKVLREYGHETASDSR